VSLIGAAGRGDVDWCEINFVAGACACVADCVGGDPSPGFVVIDGSGETAADCLLGESCEVWWFGTGA
jgi:hypothetical protein